MVRKGQRSYGLLWVDGSGCDQGLVSVMIGLSGVLRTGLEATARSMA